MRVLFLEPQPCIRALKYAMALKGRLGELVWIHFGYLYHDLTYLYGYGEEYFDEFIRLDQADVWGSVSALIERTHPDVIHSHNAPDVLTVAALESTTRVPVIHDCHEALTIRHTKYYVNEIPERLREYAEEERIANTRSDGRIYASEGVRDYIQARYRVDPRMDLVFPSYTPEALIPLTLKRKVFDTDGQTHIVYIGTVTSRIEGSHYDLRRIFLDLAAHGLHIHVYVSRYGAQDPAYQMLARDSGFIHYHDHLGQKALMNEITQYDYGWAGFNDELNPEHLDIAFPNKLTEYVACGLPILAFPHATIKRFIEQHAVGLVFKDIDELVARLQSEDAERIYRNVLHSRYSFTVESNIEHVITLYRNVMRKTSGFTLEKKV